MYDLLGISTLSNMINKRFVLSSLPIWIKEIENTVIQWAKSYLKCAKCSENLSSYLLLLSLLWFPPQALMKYLLYLTCKHIIHFKCIDNSWKLCLICLSINIIETDNMKINDDNIITNNLKT